jgi:hypothetical protein
MVEWYATAAHVVAHAHFWEQPIRIEHIASGKALLLRSVDRAIFPDDSKDTAGIIFAKGELAYLTNRSTCRPKAEP